MAKLRILLADDHTVVREGLKALINAQADMVVVGEASTGEGAWQLARHEAADVIVMDLSLPDLSGARVTARIKHARPQLKVLVLTAYEDKSYMRQLPSALARIGFAHHTHVGLRVDECLQPFAHDRVIVSQ